MDNDTVKIQTSDSPPEILEIPLKFCNMCLTIEYMLEGIEDTSI